MKPFKCRICEASDFEKLFSWELPLAADVKTAPGNSNRYSLEPVMCRSCGHVQLRETLDISSLYDEYLYTPSFSEEFQTYVQNLVKSLGQLVGDRETGKSVVEIGSSNGYLLSMMKSDGWRVLGFEPSAPLAREANDKGVDTVVDYFSPDSIGKIKEHFGKDTVDLVILRHVLEHLDDLNGIMNTISGILDDGMLVIEVPYLMRIVNEKQFYAFFHEHLSYFSVRSLRCLLEKYGFRIIGIEENDLEGGSVLIRATKSQNRDISPDIKAYDDRESEHLRNQDVIEFSRECLKEIDRLRNFVTEEMKKGKKLAAWGAGQRGCTLLNICGFSEAQIRYVVDINKNYWNRYISGVNIKVVSPEYIMNNEWVDEIIIFSTGYAGEIIDSNKKYIENGGIFIQLGDK